MATEFEALKATFEQQVVKAATPIVCDYATAGRIAGGKAASRLLDYISESAKRPSSNTILTYQAAAMEAACDRMRRSGATEESLDAWREGYAHALRQRLEALSLG
jgi:hypothetical protein